MRFLVLRRLFLVPAVVDEGSDHPDLSRFARLDELTPGQIMGRDTAMGPDLNNPASIASGGHHGASFENRVPYRFLYIDIGTGFDRSNRDQRMPVIGCGVDDDLGLFLFDQFPKILIHLGRIGG